MAKQRQTQPPKWFFWVAAGILLAIHFTLLLLHLSPEKKTMVADGFPPIVDCCAAAGIFYAAWRIRAEGGPRRQVAAWTVIGIAQVFTLLGDTLWMVYELFLGISPSPSPADIFYLLFYPVFFIGAMLLPARRYTAFEWLKKGLDVVIILLASLMVLRYFIFGPIIQQYPEKPLLLAVNLAYPVGDFILIISLLMLLYRQSRLRENVAVLYLLAGSLAIVCADLIYARLSILGTYQSGNFVDLGFSVGNLLVGLAGVHMALTASAVPAKNDPLVAAPRADWIRAVLPYLWIALGYVIFAVSDEIRSPIAEPEVVAFLGVITSIVIIRQLITLWENRSLSKKLGSAFDRMQQQAVALEQANRGLQAEVEERRKVQDRLAYDALHDALTGLPNRLLFLDRLAQAGRMKKRDPNYQFAVLFLDLDSFKVVNDSLGHVTGDMLLVQIARTLLRSVREADTVARLGGDEFVILLEDLASSADAAFAAERLQAELSAPVELEDTRVFISVSIGIVHDVEEYNRPEDILRDADLAMYQAKARGKARYEIFHQGMRASVVSRMALENDMRKALEDREFLLHYQPILSLPDQKLVGFEALVRWLHPQRGLLPPSEFIPVAEETGLILPLGKWILYEACTQARQWELRDPQDPAMRVSVNISGKQLKQPDFVELITQVLKDTQLTPSRLSLEVTESVCLDTLDSIARTLTELDTLGVETQIDDFGTGYSALSYLQRLPVHSIKIDRSFIHSISSDPDEKSNGGKGSAAHTPDIVRAIFSMINHLGIKAVAEGIETQVQLDELTRLQCAYVQGFLLAKPMDHARVDDWMAARKMLNVI